MLGWELPPYHSGGLGEACYRLCKALALKGVEIDFVVPYQNPHPDVTFMNVIPALPHSHVKLSTSGGAYDSHRLLEGDAAKSAISTLRQQQQKYTQAVKKIATSQSYDAVHAHDWLTFEAGMAIKQTGRPLIAHVHATEADRSGQQFGNPIVRDIESTALAFADKVIAVSQATKEVIKREYGIPDDKIEVLHNSIEAEALDLTTDGSTYTYLKLMQSYGYKVVVNLGRLTIQKGLTYLLQAARLVVKQNPKVLFLIAGTGDQYHELVELSAKLGIAENVIFTGVFTGGKAQRDAFAVADMFVMPSVSEPFGLTPLEAIGYGSVVLISKQCGVGEVIKNVLKFDHWDVVRLADQILAVAEHDTLREELYQNSLKEFKKLSWQDVAKVCHAIYERTLAERAAA